MALMRRKEQKNKKPKGGLWKIHGASSGNRTRIVCLEGRNNSRYTIPALNRLPLFIVREAASIHSVLNRIISFYTICTINDTLPRGKDKARYGNNPIFPIETQHLSTMTRKNNESIHSHKCRKNKNSFYSFYAVNY